MKKGFSIINIVIILGIIIVVYLAYSKYYKAKTPLEPGGLSQTELVENQKQAQNGSLFKSKSTFQEQESENKADPLPDTSTLPQERYPVEPSDPVDSQKPTGPTTNNGYYENKTYNYSLIVPADWPLKIRGDNNISLGTSPPKDGQGAIKIEIGENVEAEIAEAKAEAKKYPGFITLTEEPITIGAVVGNKLTMINNMSRMEDIYIFLIRSDLDYIIKYSNESSSYVNQVEKALNTFKFTK